MQSSLLLDTIITIKTTHPNITSLKQFFGGGADSSTCGSGVLGPGDRSNSGSSVVPAPRLHSHEDPHLSLASSTGAANWQRRGDRCFPAGDKEDLRGDGGALTGLGEARTGDVDTFTGDDTRSAVPFIIFCSGFYWTLGFHCSEETMK